MATEFLLQLLNECKKCYVVLLRYLVCFYGAKYPSYILSFSRSISKSYNLPKLFMETTQNLKCKKGLEPLKCTNHYTLISLMRSQMLGVNESTKTYKNKSCKTCILWIRIKPQEQPRLNYNIIIPQILAFSPVTTRH